MRPRTDVDDSGSRSSLEDLRHDEIGKEEDTEVVDG
jgi:hypothetical protein